MRSIDGTVFNDLAIPTPNPDFKGKNISETVQDKTLLQWNNVE